MAAPRTLEQIEELTDPIQRARAIGEYLERLEHKAADARKLRRDAIAAVLETSPHRRTRPKALADEIGVSVSLVKNVRDSRA